MEVTVESPESILSARIAEELPPGLLAHVDRVVALADELASRWGLDVALARLMARAHDVSRHLDDQQWLARAEAYRLPVDAVERAAPVLLHGPVGAEDLRRRLGVTDERVLHAVRWHTTGHPHYTPEAWAMFVADKVEPHKVRHWPALAEVLRLALEVGLPAAALRYLDLRLVQTVEAGLAVQPQAVLTRNDLLSAVGG
ncbi:MAG: bis(5'-nucleosyl)-tetraphosphatase (symmetrical) YqeK [Dehalococcoidia bacterium]|nr:bis(5'-nucleosyl)-tetraphosphatase (symmetrical) YqeK [Dehalococcoidia bacterium]